MRQVYNLIEMYNYVGENSSKKKCRVLANETLVVNLSLE